MIDIDAIVRAGLGDCHVTWLEWLNCELNDPHWDDVRHGTAAFCCFPCQQICYWL